MLVGHLVCAYWVSDSNTASPPKNGPTLLEMLERAFSSLVEPVLTWLTRRTELLQPSSSLFSRVCPPTGPPGPGGGGGGGGGSPPPTSLPKKSNKQEGQQSTLYECGLSVAPALAAHRAPKSGSGLPRFRA